MKSAFTSGICFDSTTEHWATDSRQDCRGVSMQREAAAVAGGVVGIHVTGSAAGSAGWFENQSFEVFPYL